MAKRTKPNLPSDDSLLAGLCRGLARAPEQLVDKWQGELLRFVRHCGADEHEAEDVVQETFMKFYATRDRHRTYNGSLRPLLLRMARNVWLDHARKRSRRLLAHSLEVVGEPRSPASGPSSEERHDQRLDLLAALEGLSEKHRPVVVLSVLHGLDYREIGAVLEIPLGTVKSRMHYALDALKEILDG